LIRHVKIRRSKDKLWGHFWGSLIFMGLSLSIARGSVIESKGEVSVFIGWASVTFCALGVLLAINGLLSRKPFAMEFSPTGFLDHRYFRREIPWEAVLELGTFEYRGSASVKLKLKNDILSKSQLRIKGHIQCFLNRRRGLDVFYMPMFDLDISFPGLLSILEAFLKQYQPKAIIEIPSKYKSE